MQRQTPWSGQSLPLAKAGGPADAASPDTSLTSHLTPGSFAGLVAIARGQTPDPIPNSAVKTLCAHGTAAQAAEELVAARPAKPPTLSPPSSAARNGQGFRSTIAGWSSPVARQAHNLKVVGSNPTPATTTSRRRLLFTVPCGSDRALPRTRPRALPPAAATAS